MSPPDLTILYENGPCLVVNKPAGVLTQAPPGIDSMEVRVKRLLQIREGKSHNLYFGVPHRLDRPVSGALMVARHVRAARRLSEQFQGRMIDKMYWALVGGHVNQDSGTWTDYIRKIPEQPRAEIVERLAPGAQVAILHYRVVDRNENNSWLEIRLETGRMHQIRAQAAAHGHPILGDETYGSAVPFGPTTDDRRDRWIALHARKIGFRHPMTQQAEIVEAPTPADWFAASPFQKSP